ncbi:YqiA/YcfP family alpha/beta fold hydrolase [Thalassotalea maritima]|uniref:YqiA/YcfP family alpha/beta fold hydrolase n=1 Tax=Thalassotalea maritima TaxID=3242416 RepID=UPI003529B70F
MKKLLTIHGFNSSPKSLKAEQTKAYFNQHFPQIDVVAPQLKTTPDAAIKQLVDIIESAPEASWMLTGSSLGGYFATYLASRFSIPAVLINPAVKPFELLAEVIGEHTNPYTNETYHVTSEHMQQLKRLWVDDIDVDKFMVMVQKGDEVLDYQQAVNKYRDTCLLVQEGGDHSFVGFEKMLPDVVKFFQLENNG